MKHEKILSVCFIALIPVWIILGSAVGVSFDIDFYEKEFEKNNVMVENKTEISENLISYLRYSDDASLISDFNKDEQEHLAEVRCVFQAVMLIFTISFILFILLAFFQKDFAKSLICGGFCCIGVLAVLVFSALFWESFFAGFHELFFKGVWQFPSDYLLIQLYPESFFFNSFKKILLNSFLISAGIILIGYLVKKLQP